MLAVKLRVDEGRARKALEGLRKGIIRRERLEGVKLVWLPCAIVKVKMFEQERFANKQLNVSEVINVYDLVQAQWTGMSFSYFPETEEAEGIQAVEKRYEVGDVVSRLKTLNSIRNYMAFASYGISANAVGVEVEEAREVYYPVYVGKISGKSGERFAVISGVSGNLTAINRELARVMWES